MDKNNIIRELNHILKDLEKIKNGIDKDITKEKKDQLSENLKETIQGYQKIQEEIKKKP